MAASDRVNVAADWHHASRDSVGIAPKPETTREAVVQIYAARAFGWRGAVAVHTWISIKPEGAPTYTSYEVIGWYAFHGGSALHTHNNEPDRRWFGAAPDLLTDLRGKAATRAIAAIEKAVVSYPYKDEYRTWPGPNSNTFTAYVTRRVPALAVDLPPTAIGKDYLANGAVMGRAPSGTGLQVSLFGLLGITLAAEEGVEVNLLGLAFGIDPMGLALRLPGIGRLGL